MNYELRINNKKIVVVLGTTASGKTSMAVKLANKFNGEIISADSRQVYRGMDIGTGKDLKEYKIKSKVKGPAVTKALAGKQKSKVVNVPYHLIDIISPKTEFNLAKYQKLAYKAIDDILARGKTPIIVGGTGLYIQAIVDEYKLSSAKPDKKLREKLEKMTVDKLFLKLKKLNSKKAKSLNESDRKNKRRLIRYIEQTRIATNKDTNSHKPKQSFKQFDFLLLGLTYSRDVLQKRIYKRLIERLEKENMIGEVKRLRKGEVSWKRLEEFGLEYKYISLYLRKKLTYEEMVEKLYIAIRQFSKRQMTWFKRDKRIKWVKNKTEAEKYIKKFLKNKKNLM